MRFNIINPCDPYTMLAVDLEIAAVAISAIGEGKYALEEIGGDRSGQVPFFITGGHDEWFTKQFGRNFEATVEHVVTNRAEALVKALASVFIGTPADVLAFEELAKTCPDEEAYVELKLKKHDEKRTSVNDIGRRAWSLANGVVQAELAKAAAIEFAQSEASTATIQ